jgi:hypothetical protein
LVLLLKEMQHESCGGPGFDFTTPKFSTAVCLCFILKTTKGKKIYFLELPQAFHMQEKHAVSMARFSPAKTK